MDGCAHLWQEVEEVSRREAVVIECEVERRM